MSDHRAQCKIEFTAHGKTYNLHLDWVNWYDPDGEGIDSRVREGIDSRVREFFAQSWEDAYRRYQKEVDDYFTKKNKEILEKTEQAELARLKAKYEEQST